MDTVWEIRKTMITFQLWSEVNKHSMPRKKVVQKPWGGQGISILPGLKAMAPHSSTLAWKIPWTEEPGRLQSMGSLRVGHNWATSFSLFTFMHWRRKWQPTPVFLPGKSQGWGAWWAAVYGSHRVGHDWSDLAAAGGPTGIAILDL